MSWGLDDDYDDDDEEEDDDDGNDDDDDDDDDGNDDDDEEVKKRSRKEQLVSAILQTGIKNYSTRSTVFMIIFMISKPCVKVWGKNVFFPPVLQYSPKIVSSQNYGHHVSLFLNNLYVTPSRFIPIYVLRLFQLM